MHVHMHSHALILPWMNRENNLELDVWHAEWIERLTFRLEYYILGFLEC